MGRVIEEATSIPSTEGTRRKTKGASVSACYPWLQAHLRIRKDCLSERDFLLTCQVNLILATTFRDRLVWRLIEVPGEVRHDSSVWVKRTEKVLSRIGEMAAASSPQTGFPIRVYKIHDPAGFYFTHRRWKQDWFVEKVARPSAGISIASFRRR
jgi:hypothetical protein